MQKSLINMKTSGFNNIIKKLMRKKTITYYNVGDKVRFRTREISFYANRIAGTLTSIYLNDYPEQETTGTITDVNKLGDNAYYAIIAECGIICNLVFQTDIITIIKEED